MKPATIKKILVVNVNWLGDVIFSGPAFKALKAQYPKAHIACLAVGRVGDVLACLPGIDEFILYDEKKEHKSIFAKLKFILALRRKNFDLVFLLHRSWSRAMLVFLAGIRERVGFETKHRGWLLTHPIPLPSETLHRSDHYLRVLEGYGVVVNDRYCDLLVDDAAKKKVNQLLADNGVKSDEKLIIVNTGGNWDLKRWPKKNFIRLVDALAKEFTAKIIIPGGAGDVALADEIANKAASRPLVLAGQTNLKELVALMARAQLVISADSGPMHIASGVGTKGVALFGPTRPEITGPRGRGEFSILQKDVGCNRQACYFLACPDNVCMMGLDVEEILTEVRRLWKCL